LIFEQRGSSKISIATEKPFEIKIGGFVCSKEGSSFVKAYFHIIDETGLYPTAEGISLYAYFAISQPR